MVDLFDRNKSIRSGSESRTVTTSVPDTESAANENGRKVMEFMRRCPVNGHSILQYSMNLLSLLAKEKEISRGAFFISDMLEGRPVIRLLSSFASPDPDNNELILEYGEGLPGQVAKDARMMSISDVPEGYIIVSGLGKASPASLIIFPVKKNEKVAAVIELASFHRFTHDDELFFNELSPYIAEEIFKHTEKS